MNVLPCADCSRRSDVVFVVDNSGSIRDNNPRNGSWDNWQLIREFVVTVVRSFNVSYDLTRVKTTALCSLTVRLHIENSLVVCTWGQKWPQTQSIISSLIIHVHKNWFYSLLARCLFYKTCRLFGAKLFVIVLLLYIIYTHCQPETQAVLQYSEHRSCRRPAV